MHSEKRAKHIRAIKTVGRQKKPRAGKSPPDQCSKSKWWPYIYYYQLPRKADDEVAVKSFLIIPCVRLKFRKPSQLPSHKKQQIFKNANANVINHAMKSNHYVKCSIVRKSVSWHVAKWQLDRRVPSGFGWHGCHYQRKTKEGQRPVSAGRCQGPALRTTLHPDFLGKLCQPLLENFNRFHGELAKHARYIYCNQFSSWQSIRSSGAFCLVVMFIELLPLSISVR